jgi:hypothetical protein
VQQLVEPTTIDQGRSRQGQDYAALQHYQQAEGVDSQDGSFVLLLLLGYQCANQQRYSRAARSSILACRLAAIAYLAYTKEVQLRRQIPLRGCECLGCLIRDLYKHSTRPKLE